MPIRTASLSPQIKKNGARLHLAMVSRAASRGADAAPSELEQTLLEERRALKDEQTKRRATASQPKVKVKPVKAVKVAKPKKEAKPKAPKVAKEPKDAKGASKGAKDNKPSRAEKSVKKAENAEAAKKAMQKSAKAAKA